MVLTGRLRAAGLRRRARSVKGRGLQPGITTRHMPRARRSHTHSGCAPGHRSWEGGRHSAERDRTRPAPCRSESGRRARRSGARTAPLCVDRQTAPAGSFAGELQVASRHSSDSTAGAWCAVPLSDDDWHVRVEEFPAAVRRRPARRARRDRDRTTTAAGRVSPLRPRRLDAQRSRPGGGAELVGELESDDAADDAREQEHPDDRRRLLP